MSQRFFQMQNKPSLLFWPSLACSLNEVTSLCSHPPSFCWEEMSRTHSARPITSPRRRVSSSFRQHLSPLSGWGFLYPVHPSQPLHRRQNHSFAPSLKGASDCLAHQTMRQQIFLSGAAKLPHPKKKPPKKTPKKPSHAEWQQQCQVTAMKSCWMLNSHFACYWLISI